MISLALIKWRGNWKHTLAYLLSPLGAQNKDLICFASAKNGGYILSEAQAMRQLHPPNYDSLMLHNQKFGMGILHEKDFL